MGLSSAYRCERVHRKYLKWLLGVKIGTNNMTVYGETGRLPLFIEANSEYNNCFVKAVFNHLQDEKENCKNWVSEVNRCYTE